ALSWKIAAGSAGATDLAGLGALLVLEYSDDEPGSPWDFFLYVDERGDERQREALVQIFTGKLGGTPWQQFPWVFKRSNPLGWRAARIEIDHTPRRGRLRIDENVTLRIRGPVADQ